MVGTESLVIKAISYGKEQRWIENGDMVVLIHGMTDAVAGATNVVKVIEVNAQGFKSPTNFHFKDLKTVGAFPFPDE